jgi:hypothetical protein
MTPLVCIEWRNAHQPMHTRLGCEVSIPILAEHTERHRFDAGFFTVLVIDHLRLEAVLLSPPQIHAHQHLGPVLRLRAAGSGMNVDDGIQPVVFTGQQNFRFDAIHECLEVFQLRREVVEHGLAFARKLHQGLDIIQLACYLTIEFDAFLEAGPLLIDFAGTFLIGPEIGFVDLLLQFIELALLSFSVKETSARPRCEF